MSLAMDACWQAEDAKAIFVTEALEGDDAIFLATHTPIEGFDVAGRDAGEFAALDERSVLTSLSDVNRTHAFCVVQGEPGSGKSHIIRWLSINWPQGEDVKLLLRRADGSLEGALTQLKARLPEEFAPLFDTLGKRQKASSQGRANIFLSTLANTLEVGHYDPPLDDEQWCQDFAPAEILGHARIKGRWASPARILSLLEGAKGERNSASATFDLFDIESLADLLGVIYNSGVSGKAEELARRLVREGETIAAYRAEGWLADELAADIEAQGRLRTSIAFLKVLNRRKNDAIQNVLGVSAEGLKTLFRSVRQALAQRGQRLVLLLEDITSWEGLDDSLIDVLTFNAEARGDEDEVDVCPLISVVGVTPAYYDKLQPNFKQRITHEIRLGEADGGLQDVATLRDPRGRRQFLARYLSAVRAGEVRLNGWRREFADDDSLAPPNRCDPCLHRESCFATFGREGDIGLFPFTPTAIDNMFEALKENDGGQTWKTPRGMLQAILNPSLSQPDALVEGRFPPRHIEPTAFKEDRRSDRALSRRLNQIVSNKIEDPVEQARMRRLLAYWADPDRADTTERDGELAFATAPKSLFEALRLPWLGQDVAGAAPADEAAPVIEPVADVPLEVADAPEPGPATSLLARPVRPTVSIPKPKRASVKASEFDILRDSARAWAASERIETASRWNTLLYEIVSRLDCRRINLPPALFTRLVTAERVKLEGTTSGARDYLILPREAWALDGLEAYLALGWDKALSAGDADFHRRNLAAFMSRLEQIAAAFISRRVPTTANGELWRPAGSIAQILLLRGWLRGSVSPEAPLWEQLRDILSDEQDPTSDLRARCLPWQEWLAATDKFHTRLRAELRALIALPLATADGVPTHGLTDVSDVAPALARLVSTGFADAPPQGDCSMPDEFGKTIELLGVWKEKGGQIDRTELAQLKNRGANLMELLRGRSIADHLKRLDAAISPVSILLPAVGTERISAFKATFDRLKSAGRLDAEVLEPMEDWLLDMEDAEAVVPAALSKRLGWLARTPARALDDVNTLCQDGERLVDLFYEHAAACVRDAAGAASLTEIQETGRAIAAAATAGPGGEA
ncbi:MAG: hypothetical protein Q7J13_05600 [Brevundimonas sp.]|uniref:hypothetical protein n=1 Tax=Brevundimonas sp. TaxID=1871086 RepID=UPI002718C51C|nr:hypothetical protein [Brevundimonas sp.]MDO9587392.1 hypothetical protein [Brevundimonas sp.]